MTAFATPADLATRLKRTFTDDEAAWVTVLLEDAAADIRLITGHVYPSVTATFTAYPSDGWVDMPQRFVTSITAVERDGTAVTFTRHENSIRVDCDKAVDVTFTYGLTEAPRELLALNCVMVSQAITLVENGLGLKIGGLSSVALDDFKVAFADAGEMTGSTIPQITADRLAAVYQQGGYVVEANR